MGSVRRLFYICHYSCQVDPRFQSVLIVTFIQRYLYLHTGLFRLARLFPEILLYPRCWTAARRHFELCWCLRVLVARVGAAKLFVATAFELQTSCVTIEHLARWRESQGQLLQICCRSDKYCLCCLGTRTADPPITNQLTFHMPSGSDFTFALPWSNKTPHCVTMNF